MSKEHKLQAEMAVSFSQQRPNQKGLLWSTRNITLSVRDGMKQKALGMIAGVADLCYFRGDTFVGIEVKFPGEDHKREQIERQLKWGKMITKEGGHYFIVTTLDAFWAIIKGKPEDFPGIFTVEEIEEKLKTDKATIRF